MIFKNPYYFNIHNNFFFLFYLCDSQTTELNAFYRKLFAKIIIFLFFFSFLNGGVYWGLNTGPHVYQACALPPSYTLHSAAILEIRESLEYLRMNFRKTLSGLKWYRNHVCKCVCLCVGVCLCVRLFKKMIQFL